MSSLPPDLFNEMLEFPLLRGFDRSVVERLLHGGSVRQHKHREVLFRVGTPAETFAIVVSGAYKLVRPTARGDDIIVYFSTPGDVIGALIMNQPNPTYPISAYAMGPSRTYCIPRSTYMSSWATDLEIQKRIQSFLYARMSLLQDDRALAKAPLSQRLACLLIGLLERNEGETHLIPIPLTRQEMADALGVAVESVIRIMSEWSHAGIVRTNSSHIEIVRPEKIIEIVKST